MSRVRVAESSIALLAVALGAPCITCHPATQTFLDIRDSARPLHEAAESCDLARVRYLVEIQKTSPNALDTAGFTPLHVAWNCSHVYWDPPDRRVAQIVEYLLSHGADPNLPFRYGPEPRYTLLHRAAYNGNMVLVPLLVSAGANVNAKDSRGFAPLHSAARCDYRLSCDDCSDPAQDDFGTRWKQGAKPVIQYLVAHGADVTAKTQGGQSVLDIFVTPCVDQPKLCVPESLVSASWPTGTCKAAYLAVRSELNRIQQLPR